MVSKYVILTFLFCISYSSLSWAVDFPNEVDMTLRNQKYSPSCVSCTNVLSIAYCSPFCCSNCQDEAINQSLNTEKTCDGICLMNESPTTSDQSRLSTCMNNGYADATCSSVEPFKDRPSVDENHNFDKRVRSCEDAVLMTKKYCTIDHLNSIYPRSLFELAEQIRSSTTCNLEDVDNFNVRSQFSDPQDKLGLCARHYNDCKSYCYENNVIYLPTRREYEDGQKKYENICGPKFAEFDSERTMREEVIEVASEKVSSCLAGGSSGGEDPDDDDETAQSKTADEGGALSSPQAAMGRLNEIVSAIAPYLPANNGGVVGARNVIARRLPPEGQAHRLTDLEKYGAPYEGYDPSDADALDYDDGSFDKPKSLQTPRGSNPSRGNMGMGGGVGMLGQSGGGSRSNGAPPGRGSKGAGRKLQKDKTLFGKAITGSNPGYSSGGAGATSGRSRSGFNQPYLNSNGKSTKEFNASKYHQAILASYDKGLNSQAHRQAQRRAAGLLPEDSNSKSNRGYTSWHIENKIHPETISLFMQAKLCYYAKFRSDFSSSCAPRP